MRADYVKPSIEFEEYELNTNIASGCETIVSFGPGDEKNPICEEYKGAFDWEADALTGPFYDDASCSCYLSAGDKPLSTS